MVTDVESRGRHGEDAACKEHRPELSTIPSASLKQIRFVAPVRLTRVPSAWRGPSGGTIACSAEINEPVAVLQLAVLVDDLIA